MFITTDAAHIDAPLTMSSTRTVEMLLLQLLLWLTLRGINDRCHDAWLILCLRLRLRLRLPHFEVVVVLSVVSSQVNET